MARRKSMSSVLFPKKKKRNRYGWGATNGFDWEVRKEAHKLGLNKIAGIKWLF